eukprot:COSAG01_NODE_42283_length_441_cov_4.137427_1_plen_68_part_10
MARLAGFGCCCWLLLSMLLSAAVCCCCLLLLSAVTLLPVGSQAKFCLFSETPDFRVLRPSPPARPILR